MADTNGKNGKWSLAFWIVTIICGTGLFALTSAVVANDRLRASEDADIRKEVVNGFKEQSCILTEIQVDIGKISSKLERL